MICLSWPGSGLYDLHDLHMFIVGLHDLCLSVGLHDLQEMYDLQDLQYLTGVYLRGILMCVMCTSSPGEICMTRYIFHTCVPRWELEGPPYALQDL